MKAGSLRHPIIINAQTTQADAYGQPLSTWIPLHSCWASVTAISSKELFSIGGFSSQVTHKVTIRYPAAVTIMQGAQLKFEGRSLTVQAISDPDGQRRELDLFCLEVPA